MICGKTVYNSTREAIEAIKGMLGDINKHSDKQPSRAYWCSDCSGYHVATENKRKKKKLRKSKQETDSTHPKMKENNRKFKELIIHDPRKFKVK